MAKKLWVGLVLLGVGITGFVAVGAGSDRPAKPRAIQGVLDLRDWNFSTTGPLKLSGEWEFYWRKLLSPDELDSAFLTPDYLFFPSLWNDITLAGKSISPRGYATYRLVVLTDASLPLMALEIPDFYTSYELWVDGRLFARNGEVGTRKKTTVPQWLPLTRPLEIAGPRTEIVLQIANFHHGKGGASNPIYLGTDEQLTAKREMELALDLLLTGSLIMGGLFFLGLFLFGRKETFILYFALFCLTYSYRIIGFGLYYIHNLFSGLSWGITTRLEYLTLFLSTALFANFVLELYPRETSRRAIRFLQILCGSLMAITVLLPARVFTTTLDFFFAVLVGYLVYCGYIFVKAAFNQRDGAVYAVISFVMILMAFFLELLNYYEIIDSSPIFTFAGYLGFFFFQSLILSYRFARDFQRSAEAAEAGGRAKSEFLATISHEIRTPMNGVIGMTELLLDTPLTAKQREYVETIHVSGENLLAVMNDVLDYSRIESGKLRLVRKPLSLVAGVEEVLVLLSSGAAKKNLELTYYIDPDVPPVIETDPVRLKQVLVNLLSNAIKFTERGEIVVSIHLLGREEDVYELQFAVQDTGIGIPADKIDRLFQLFSQVDSSTTRKFGGTGLGLAICKMLVKMMDGSIWVESREGRGSTFYFTIKAHRPAPKTAKKADPSLAGLRNLRAFVVDDNTTNLRILQTLLSKWGVKTTVTDQPRQALEMLNERGEEYDVAIVDMQMPGIDGRELSQRIRRRFSETELPIIMLCSLDQSAETNGESGYAAYLTKPIRQEHLLETLRGVAQRKPKSRPDTAGTVPEPAEHFAAAGREDFRILIAEDNLVNQRVVLNYLQRLGLLAEVVETGREALEAMRNTSYDLVFMDVQMPEMDGLEATRRIRAEERGETSSPVIIAMTANAMKGDEEKCLAAGMNDYIPKPLHRERLAGLLRKWFPDLHLGEKSLLS